MAGFAGYDEDSDPGSGDTAGATGEPDAFFGHIFTGLPPLSLVCLSTLQSCGTGTLSAAPAGTMDELDDGGSCEAPSVRTIAP